MNSSSSFRIVVSLFFISSFLILTSGLYFVVNHKDDKCFTIEQPRDTPVVFAYEILDADHIVNFSLYYGGKPTDDLLILNKEFVKPIGHVDFITDNDGIYAICLNKLEQDKDEKSQPATRIKLSVNYGYDNEYYAKLSTKEHFEAINMEVHKLNDMMTMTLNEADYQKHKEIEYHTLTERMNIAALWWPMAQIAILVVMGVFQVQHLKHFFKNHKVI
mmetsp:Transcript_21342/g.20644  ORF Transcript_21342/g.20644 Transcript_21342/m.20644 type:complete len:217 (-) Transcript_21342:502-1152(-)